MNNIVRLDDYRRRDLARRYDDLIVDATYILECSMLLVMAAVEMQLAMLNSMKKGDPR